MPQKLRKTSRGHASKFHFLAALSSIYILFAGLATAQQYQLATLYISPSSGSINNEEVIEVAIRIDSGQERVNVVQIDLAYPAGQLEFNGVDDSGSSFDIAIKSSGGEGKVEITRAAPTPVKGDNLIAKLNFKAKQGTGSATVNFSDKSVVVSPDYPRKNIAGTMSGGTYILTTPAPPPPPPVPAAPSIKKPDPKTPASEARPPKDEGVAFAVTTPDAERRNNQSQVGFWIPMIVLIGTLLVSMMAASGFTARGIYRHFKFLRPVNRLKHYPHL